MPEKAGLNVGEALADASDIIRRYLRRDHNEGDTQ